MDELLERRYLNLLYHYDSGGEGRVAEIKQRLLGKLQLLRPDAALCLLTLYDQMIVRAYDGKLFETGKPEALPSANVTKKGDFNSRVFSSLEHLLNALEKLDRTEPRSSHDVIIVINEAWAYLSDAFMWA